MKHPGESIYDEEKCGKDIGSLRAVCDFSSRFRQLGLGGYGGGNCASGGEPGTGRAVCLQPACLKPVSGRTDGAGGLRRRRAVRKSLVFRFGTCVPGAVGKFTVSVGERQSQETVQSAVTVQEPEVAAQGASLYNATTGQFLYIKNGDTQYYPASITKLMTALLVAENCDLSDTVTFSSTATTNLEAGAVSLNLTEGDQLTVEQCLYALLLKSANEVGNALAEHVAGSNQAFADMMNAKAASLGCTNTILTIPMD